MICSNKAADLFKALCAATLILFSVNACTEVDDNLGGNLVPVNQRMSLHIDNIDQNYIKTYTYKQDSLVASALGYVYFGKESGATFGKRKNSFIIQFLPTSLPYESGYGFRPIVDSLYLVLPLSSAHGDTTKVQKFDVYEILWDDNTLLPKPIHRDTTYYTFFDPAPYKGDRLFSFEHTGHRDVMTKLDPTPEGEAYLKSIIKFAEEELEKYKDTLFLQKFKGWYVEPAGGSPDDAATYSTSLEDAYMMLYARNHDSVDVSAIYDTIASSFMFYDQEDFGNASINMVGFDYTGTPVATALAATAAETPQATTYVQTMGGVSTRLEFTDEMISTLRNLRDKIEDGDPKHYDGIMINQAEMYIWLDGNTDDYMVLNNSMKRLGSYTGLTKLTAIPDYLYYYEASYQQSDASYTLPYNGYLNRSNGYYKLDITSYVQQLAKGEDGDEPAIQPEFYVAPDAYGFYSFGESVLKGAGSGKPIEIRVTYTLIDDRD